MWIFTVTYIASIISLGFSQIQTTVQPGKEPSGRRGDVLSMGNVDEQVIFNVDNSQDNGARGPGTPGGPHGPVGTGGPYGPHGPGGSGGQHGPGGPGGSYGPGGSGGQHGPGGPYGPGGPHGPGGPSGSSGHVKSGVPGGQCILPPGKTVEQARAECMCDSKPQQQQPLFQSDYDYPSYG